MENKLVGFKHNEVVWILDPMGHFSFVGNDQLIKMIGLIPEFITEETENVVQEALDRYGMSFGGPMKGSIIVDGVLKYPGDPDLYPVASSLLHKKNMVIYVYEYGIIAFVDLLTSSCTVYRFD